jgi:hypothetical protein
VRKRAQDTHSGPDQKVQYGTVFAEPLEYGEGTSDAKNEPDEGSYDAGPDKWSLHGSRSS